MMTVGELKQLLCEVCDDSLPVNYLPPDTGLNDAYDVNGALVVEKSTGKTQGLRGVYLLEG
jgi:hypothetical protein